MTVSPNTCFGAPDPPRVRTIKGLAPLHNRALVFYDQETGGFHRSQPVIEFAAIKRYAGGPPHREETLCLKVHVSQWEIDRMEPGAVKVTGFRPEEWEGATPKTEAFALLHDWIGACTVVGMNIGGDLKRLRAEFDASQIPLVWNFCEPLELSTLLRAAYPNWPAYNLEEACRQLGIEAEQEHRAIGGATRAKQIWDHLWSRTTTAPQPQALACTETF